VDFDDQVVYKQHRCSIERPFPSGREAGGIPAGERMNPQQTWSIPARVPTRVPAHVRLTRRGRAVVLLVLVTLLMAAFSLGRVGSEAAAGGSADTAPAAPQAQTVVHAGETLWAVAKRIAPDADPRSTVYRLRQVNDLPGSQVRAGQLLLLPR
jgi:Na+-transporting methylmalonyl-CoA/oxaloacetate decarboxylase gamma subunit